jgi:hypothetical protein
LSSRKAFLIDLALFAATVYAAWYKGWQVADLAWSLWISSLTLGYLYIIVSIIGTLIQGPVQIFKSRPSQNDGKPSKYPIAGAIAPVVFILFLTGFSVVSLIILPYLLLIVFCRLSPILRKKPGWGFLPDMPPVIPDLLIALPIMLFMLAFFTVHFGGFHMVHGMFLNMYFPLLGKASVPESITGDISLFKVLIMTALSRYWIFVLASALNSWKSFVRAYHVNDGMMMMRPYLNVVRMHLMIFVFAIAGALKFQNTVMYIMLALYFFPVFSLIGIFRKDKKPGPQGR